MAKPANQQAQFFSTFVSGLHEVAAAILKKSVPHVRIIQLMDGAVFYECAAKNPHLPCFHNTFYVLDAMRGHKDKAMDLLMRREAAAKPSAAFLAALQNNGGNARSFRVVTSRENQLIAVDPAVKGRVEQMIRQYSRLALNKSKADVEFWFLTRSEGYTFFLKRLTQNREQKKGSLHPELCYVLNHLSNPQRDDVFLDAFCGYGSIAKSRAAYGKARQILAFDNDKGLIQALLKEPVMKQIPILYEAVDIRFLARRLAGDRVDKIVADPPWGLYQQENVEPLYREMLEQFALVLKTGGILVLLTACKDLMRDLFHQTAEFAVVCEYAVLVSGKKAAIFVAKRK